MDALLFYVLLGPTCFGVLANVYGDHGSEI